MDAQTQAMDDLVDVREASRIVKVHPATIRRWVQSRKFPAPFLRGGAGATTRWRRSDITNWMQKEKAA